MPTTTASPFTYVDFTCESALNAEVKNLNKGRKASAFFSTERKLVVRLFQASCEAYGSIRYCNGVADDAVWNFRPIF